jgi:hypothetical protein
MFSVGDTVICVDDTFPNPNCTFPKGVVVRGHRYTVVGVTIRGGVQIAELPVFCAPVGIEEFARYFQVRDFEVGWKPHRFRKVWDEPSTGLAEEDEDLELVGARR